MLNYKSCYQTNETVNWIGGDSKEAYQQNLLTNYKELATNGWINASFTYKFNSLGFRCDEFNSNPSVMCLGCSITVGIGLPIETIWPELVSKQLNMRCINLGQGGSGPDTAFRLCYGYIDRVNPQIVVYMQPPPNRFELISAQWQKNISVHCTESIRKQLFKIWTVDENNNYFNQRKNALAIQMLCEQRNIKFIFVDSKNFCNSLISKSRDLLHPGVEEHKQIANSIIAQI